MKYTLKDFIENEIAVKFKNEEEQMKFLKECEKEGLKWRNREKPTEFKPNFRVVIAYGMVGDGISYGNSRNWQTVNFSDFVFADNNEIHITTDGVVTHAILKENGKVAKRSKAICSPQDEFNFEYGAKLAFDRLFGIENADHKEDDEKSYLHVDFEGDEQHIVNAVNVNNIMLMNALYC